MKNLVAGLLIAALQTTGASGWARDLTGGFDITITPQSKDGVVGLVSVDERFSAPGLKAGDTLVRMPVVIASIPTARYDGGALTARDDAGPLPLTLVDEPPQPFGQFRSWKLSRAPKGRIEVAYAAPPRTVGPKTRPGPLFDVRAEGQSVSGAGLTFLALPQRDGPQRVRLHWDLHAMPSGSRGVWSLGDGDVETTTPIDTLADSFYAAGPLMSYPADGAGAFSMYWLSPPPFDPVAIARSIKRFYGYEARFFGDPDADYRVFVRRQPYAAGGGTALTRSFMFGYSPQKPESVQDMQFLLAHEITHNWPALEHDDQAADNWFAEGSAEYYSLRLLLRSGVIGPDAYLKAFNERAEAYYTNPLNTLSSAAVSKLTWQDDRAQVIPYGRGLLYLANTDAEIRVKSGGKRSLDDVEQALVEAHRQGRPYGLQQWLTLVSDQIGPGAVTQFDAMKAGQPITPLAETLAPCFAPVRKAMRQYDLGFDRQSLTGKDRVVKGVVPQSAAAAAGVMDGDVVLDHTDIQDTTRNSDERMTLTLQRGQKTMVVSYLPRGRTVEGWQWLWRKGQTPATCRL